MQALTADATRLRDLRRMKLIATGLLVFAAVVFVVARVYEDEGTWVGYVESAAEAAMVGALADWFAVTALFRYPLGIPIPHTAIIPRRKDDIGRSLGDFVQGNFLTPEVIGERLAGAKISDRLGHWLAQPANAERAAEAAADALGGVVEVLDDRDVQEALGTAVEKRLARTEVAPLLGKAIDVAIEGGHHQRMLDGVMRGLVDVPRRQPGDVARPPRPGVTVVGTGSDRRPCVQQDLHRSRALPRRRLGDSGSRGAPQHRRQDPGVGGEAAQTTRC